MISLPPASVHGPQITLAIPYYSGREYLEQTIGSVKCQTSPSWRLLICDDCGPGPAIDTLVARHLDPRVRYVRNEANLGMAGNWNRCLDLAETDLVTLLHADDELLEGYCQLMENAAGLYPQAAAFFCLAKVIDERGGGRFSFPDFVKRFLLPGGSGPVILKGHQALTALLRGDFIMCPTVCYRKSVLGSRRFDPSWKSAQDLELFTRLLLQGETIVGLRTVAYAYRRHANNAMVHYTEDLLRFREEVLLYDMLGKEARARRWRSADREARAKLVIKLNLAFCALQDLFRFQLAAALKKCQLLAELLAGRRERNGLVGLA